MKTSIALAGNPNSGKTTMFNELTGSSQYVGNWPGVTVEKKGGRLKGHKDVELVDLPGIYSLSPYTLEEIIARDFLIQEKPDAIINIVDSSNMERNLYLTTQLLELGIPVVVALNMTDVVRRQGDKIDIDKLSLILGCPVLETSALKGEGCQEVAQQAVQLAQKKTLTVKPLQFSAEMEKVLADIEPHMQGHALGFTSRWTAIKLFERDEMAWGRTGLHDKDQTAIELIIAACEANMDDDCEAIITNERYMAIGDIMKECVMRAHKIGELTTSDKIDRIVTNRWLALPIFAAAMFVVYYVSVTSVGTMMTDWVNEVMFGDVLPPALEGFLVGIGCADWLVALLLDGVLAGVGAVLGFLPQMLVLFLFLAILEDCGYMARVAFIMDRIFRKFGLSGKSFIPMLIGTGCGVPAVMASRTIESERDRRMTIMTTTFIPCSAKLPVIALIVGAFFPQSAWVAPSAYFIGVGAIVISGIILKKTRPFLGVTAPFVMELPPYHLPGGKGVIIHMWDRAKSFIIRAGTIILIASVVIWFLSTFNWSMQMVDAADSMLASIGMLIAPIFLPLGWTEWQGTVATLTGLVAKETVVSTFGILYGFAEVAENGNEVWTNLRLAFTPLAGFSFLVFNLLCAPCFAAIGAIRREMGNAKWTWIAIGYQTVFAYVITLIIYQLSMLFTTGVFTFTTAVAFVLVIALLYLLFRPEPKIVHQVQKPPKDKQASA